MKILLVMLMFFLALVASDLKNISLVSFADRVSKQTLKNIYIDEDLNASISLYIPDRISDKDIFKVFEKTINKKGFNLRKLGDVYYVSKKIKYKKNKYLYKLKYNSYEDCKSLFESYDLKYKYLKDINSFIIFATEKEYPNILYHLRSVDIEQKQVTLKIMIFEFTEDDIKERGIQWGTIYQNISDSTVTALNSIVASVNTISTPIASNNFYSAIHLLDNNKLINVKQFPFILAKNNKSFTFEAVENIPYLVKTTKTQATNTSEENSIQYKDVGLKINGRSLIHDKYVTLDIDLIIEDIVSNDNNMPLTYKRVLKSNTNIDFGKVLVLSGIKRNKTVHNDYSIPYLSNIPFLGALFEYKTQSEEQINITISIEVIASET